MQNYDESTIYEKIDTVFTTYEGKRIDELLSPAKGASRISVDQIQATTGKAQACRELFTLLCNEFGFTA